MKTIAKITMITFLGLLVVRCQKENSKITNIKDYNQYLTSSKNKTLELAQKDIIFWQEKFEKAPNQISYLEMLASNYSKLFEITGSVDNLKEAEKLLVKSNEAYKYSSVLNIRALAWNFTLQHKNKEALVLAYKAKTIGEGIKETEKLLFDIQMELGNYKEAKKNLDLLSNQTDFDYLIRVAKWNEHLGDLKTAIVMMEKAKTEAETYNNNDFLRVWTYSYLAYLNGHSGKIQHCYDYYLKTLAIDANNSNALKGIAWIFFLNDSDIKEAKRIIGSVSKRENPIDFSLLKNQIAEFENHRNIKPEIVHHKMNMLENSIYTATAATKLMFLPERN